MWNAVLDNKCKVNRSDEIEVVSLPEGATWLTGASAADYSRHLFARHCDKVVYDHMVAWQKEGGRGCLLTGNPGIGKSWSLSYFLYRYAQEMDKDIFFDSVAARCGFLFKREDRTVTRFHYPYPMSALDHLTSNCIYLFDPAGDSNARGPIPVESFTINAAPPNKLYYKSFLKRGRIKKMYMPCWSLDEVLSVVDYVPGLSPDKAKEYFELFGGIPRYIFNSILNPQQEADAMDDAVRAVDQSHLVRFNESLIDDMMIGRILQLNVGPECGNPIGVQFASPIIEKRVAAAHFRDYQVRYAVRLFELSGYPHTKSLFVEGFKYIALIKLGLGRDLYIRNLKSNETTRFQCENITQFDDTSKDLRTVTLRNGLYFRPSKKKPVFDALMMMDDVVYLFKITVSRHHTINGLRLEEQLAVIRKQLGDKVTIRLVFVVPSHIDFDYSTQRVKGQVDVELPPQFVVGLGYDMDALESFDSQELRKYCHLLKSSPPPNTTDEDLIVQIRSAFEGPNMGVEKPVTTPPVYLK